MTKGWRVSTARKIGKSASRFGSLESLLFAPAPLKSLNNAEKFGSRLVERRASKSATAFYALFVRENTQFWLCGNDFHAKKSIFREKSKKNLFMSKKSCTFAPAFEKKLYGGLSSVGRASDCGSECQGFEPLIPPAWKSALYALIFFFISILNFAIGR